MPRSIQVGVPFGWLAVTKLIVCSFASGSSRLAGVTLGGGYDKFRGVGAGPRRRGSLHTLHRDAAVRCRVHRAARWVAVCRRYPAVTSSAWRDGWGGGPARCLEVSAFFEVSAGCAAGDGAGGA